MSVKETIDNLWETYHVNVIPPEASAQQVTECRRAFYAGLVSCTVPMAMKYGKAVKPFVDDVTKCTKEFILDGATVEANDKGARLKFPANVGLLCATGEEFGELCAEHNRLLHGGAEAAKYNSSNLTLYTEAVQLAAMAARIAVEGDPFYPYTPSFALHRNFKPTGAA